MSDKLAVSEFVKRQTADSQFSHFDGGWQALLLLTLQHFDKATPGYRDGVCLVPVPADKFYSAIVQLEDGDLLAGDYTPRQEGEEPRKSVNVVGGKKMQAKSCQIVCYRHDVLAENEEHSCDAEWEIISINASPFEADVEIPMGVGTLIANYFQFSGGTEMKGVDAEQFCQKLKASATFWKDKAHAAPADHGEYYVAIMVQYGSGPVDSDNLSPSTVKFFGHDYVAANRWKEQKALIDETWNVIKCAMPKVGDEYIPFDQEE